MKFTEPDNGSDNAQSLGVLEAAINVGVALVVGYVEICAVMGEDQTRLVKATILRAAENFCQQQAVLWARMADACKTAYDRTRLVA